MVSIIPQGGITLINYFGGHMPPKVVDVVVPRCSFDSMILVLKTKSSFKEAVYILPEKRKTANMS